MKQLNFQSENLAVNYFSFNIQGSRNLKLIIKYLFQKFVFNSTIFKKFNHKWESESLNYDRQNEFQVSFRQH